ncbi:MAG TPA: hypothetical protein VGC87_02255 [Pyrinomonadaceae bacterium]|jgi:hypothetical protein
MIDGRLYPGNLSSPQGIQLGAGGLVSASIHPSVIDPFSGRMTRAVVARPILVGPRSRLNSKPIESIQTVPFLELTACIGKSWFSFLSGNVSVPKNALLLFDLIQTHKHSHTDIWDPECGTARGGFFDFEPHVIRPIIHRTKEQIHMLFINGINRILGSNLKALLEGQKQRAKNALRKLILHREKIKGVNKPLLFLPHTLHPDVSVAH